MRYPAILPQNNSGGDDAKQTHASVRPVFVTQTTLNFYTSGS